MKKLLIIVPARRGSKGVPKKNLADLGGRQLLAYTLEVALRCSDICTTVVSTDCPSIAKCAEEYGASLFGLRPAHLATDEAKTIDVIQYELDFFEAREKHEVEAVVLLQPTAPLRTEQDVREAIRLFRESGADSLISVCDASHVHLYTMYREQHGRLVPLLTDKQGVRRQDFPEVYLRNGAVYIAKRSLILEQRRLICDAPAFYRMPRGRSVNIDDAFDLRFANFLVADHDASAE